MKLITADYDGRQPSPDAGLTGRELFDTLSKIRAPVVVFLDTCHAAAALTGRNQVSWGDLGMAVFAAARSTESALSNEDPDAHDPLNLDHGGLFTSLIRKCLNQESETKTVTISGLRLFIQNQFPLFKQREINFLNERLRSIETQKKAISGQKIEQLIKEQEEYMRSLEVIKTTTQSPVIIIPEDVPNLILARPSQSK